MSGREGGNAVPSSSAVGAGDASGVTGVTRRGRCKWFNVAKGWGFVTPNDGGQDVFVHQSVIQMPGFRSLGDEEEVEFECKESDKGLEATRVSGPSSVDCQGSHRRPLSKKRFRKIRKVTRRSHQSQPLPAHVFPPSYNLGSFKRGLLQLWGVCKSYSGKMQYRTATKEMSQLQERRPPHCRLPHKGREKR
ncbi:unnamed protein product [Chilo suppressalis]|uniref:CSD domain-containing protein n=1 Tax=Chilo suppressalis TaxID=168631 RepID=A0ABN8BHI4_CHISP|nr:unnamed protein product [Chilo suppressalis]